MHNSSNKIFLSVVFGLVLLVGLYLYAKPKSESIPSANSISLVDQQSPESSNLDGETHLSEFAQYQQFSPDSFVAAADKRRVYFFHATWCPTCRAAHEDLLKNAGRLPNDVIVFRIDYDTASELKQKFGVTYQHTFVQVDKNGELVKIWNGGSTAQIISQLN